MGASGGALGRAAARAAGAARGARRERALLRYRADVARRPVDGRAVLLEQQCGLTPDGNLFYLARLLARDPRYAGYTAHFAADPARMGEVRSALEARGLLGGAGGRGVELVERRSRRYYELLATAGHLVCDTSFPPELCKRPGQVLANTWHGTPLKALGRHAPGEAAAMGNTQRCFLAADLVLVPSGYAAGRLAGAYMFDRLGAGRSWEGGYPRNAALLRPAGSGGPGAGGRGDGLPGGRLYAYLPTFRGTGASKDGDLEALAAHLRRADSELGPGETLLVRLHPAVGGRLDLSGMRRVRPFPAGTEPYEVLARCNALATDYSSVMFDFAATRRKVVLFCYDEDEYLAERGAYLALDELPFPRVRDAAALVGELRRPRGYDDAALLRRFCPHDAPDADARALDAILAAAPGPAAHVAGRGRPRAVVFSEDPAGQAGLVRAACRAFARDFDVTLAFPQARLREDPALAGAVPDDVGFYPLPAKPILAPRERLARELARRGALGARGYAAAMDGYHAFETRRLFGGVRADACAVLAAPDWRQDCLRAAFPAGWRCLVAGPAGRGWRAVPADYGAWARGAFDCVM